MTIVEMLEAAAKRNHEAFGTNVRCPECGAGIGKFCLKAGVAVHQTAADIAVHARRVALANPLPKERI